VTLRAAGEGQVLEELVGETRELAQEFAVAIRKLEGANDHPEGLEGIEHAKYMRDRVLTAMDAVRAVADRLEGIVAETAGYTFNPGSTQQLATFLYDNLGLAAGRYLTAAFDYGSYVCQFETGTDFIPRFDAYLEVYGAHKVIRVQYDTPYVVNLPIRLFVTEANGQGGTVEQNIYPTWGDAFVIEWEAFYDNVANHRTPKTSIADFRQDLELFKDMIALMR